MCRAQLTDVGADSYVSRLTQEAKRAKKPQQSEMMRALQNLVKWIGVIVIPLGVVMFIKEFVWLDRAVPIAVTSTVGSIIGMIPEGLYLLTSLALVAGVVRLAQRKTLVHELGCIETLARVDTLCVDKTGTVTENKMIVEDVCPLCDDRFTLDDIRMIMADYVYAMQADNDTMAALRRYFTGEKTQDATATLPFSSAKKYGGVSFHDEETYLLGAPDVLLAGRENPYQEQIEGYSAKGCRVLLLGMYDGALSDETPDAGLLPIALILLSNKIRAEAPETFGYFAAQGVAVKVISGDNARTVSEVAKRAGIENADRFVDARTLTSEEAIREAAGKYTVFGRVTPAQKRSLVQALKAEGHTVAMTATASTTCSRSRRPTAQSPWPPAATWRVRCRTSCCSTPTLPPCRRSWRRAAASSTTSSAARRCIWSRTFSRSSSRFSRSLQRCPTRSAPRSSRS